ncbi:MAG: nuclear transport factor 2 family protein [Candidatus Dormibacteraceae bacterium]
MIRTRLIQLLAILFGRQNAPLRTNQHLHNAAADLLENFHREQGKFYAGGDDSRLRSLLTEDITWHVPGDNLIAGDYHSLDEVFAYFTRRRDLANHTMQMHPRELLVGNSDCVASVTDGTATIDGVAHSWSTVGLYRIVEGQVVECWLLPLDPVAFDLVWSATNRIPSAQS